jgi:serine/threonine protein kinase
MSVVKVAESLDHPGNIVAAKIQGSTKHNSAYRDDKHGGYRLVPQIKGTKDEESILAILGEFLGHASNSFLCKLGFTKNKYDKQYTFLKLKKGQTVYKCFESNKNNLRTNQAEQLKIFLAILQATKKLHDHKIIHGDLNFNNFMINDEGQVDVIDYGMAGKANERGLIKNDNASQWVDPEALRQKGMHNFKSDIYTLGWWMRAMLKHFATSSSLKTNTEFQKLLNGMTCYDSTNRPSIDECINRMSSILEQEQRKLPQNARGQFGMGS